MWIKLHKKGPPMWFLGEPKDIKVSLNFNEPGPVELDFKSLESKEQKQVLIGLRGGKIESDVDYESLRDIYVKSLPKEELENIVKKEEQTVLKKEDSTIKLKKKKEKREKKIRERCELLCKQSIRAIRDSLKKEKDIKLLKAFLEAEKANKGRVSVVDYLEGRIRKFQQEVAVHLKKEEKNKPLETETPGATYFKDVVESRERTISLTSQELAELVAGKEL